MTRTQRLSFILLLVPFIGGPVMADEWPFADKRNVAVFSTGPVISGDKPIHYVTHDVDDGAWQFHADEAADMSQAKVVSLENIVKLDPSVKSLADLPLGWSASRKSSSEEWVRKKES